MSRLGKKPIEIPAGVQVQVTGQQVKVKGPKGELSLNLHPRVKGALEGNQVKVAIANESVKSDRALWGLSARLIEGMIVGVTKGFEKKLEIQGIGYKAALAGDKLELHLGYSHPVYFQLPTGVKAAIEKNIITISGIDKQLVGDITARVRALRKPEVYKGKGIRYLGEVVKLKPGKAATKGAAGAGAA